MGCGCRERRAKMVKATKKQIKEVSTKIDDIMKKIYGDKDARK